MTPSEPKETWNAIEGLFDRASELAPEDRDAYLETCGEAPEVVDEVRKLLASDRLATRDGFLAPIASRGESTELRAGPYVLYETLGRGGMGVVYRAERVDGQFEDHVAVKILRRELDRPDQRRRFLTERQILAALRHPNIAYLLDGGVTDGGSPYLVMELVNGEPIDRFCARHRLTVNQRLRLFIQVVEAVEHAHRNLVVHRDLKPSNVLVAVGESGGEPRAKLLDFGIAKLTEEGQEALTRTGGAVLTPLYASPEQVLGKTVTTASDVYQLGVLLYELLTGARPYGSRTSSAAELARAILQDDPEAPSRAASRVRATPSEEPPAETRPSTPSAGGSSGSSPQPPPLPDAPETAGSESLPPDYFELHRAQRADLDALLLTALAKTTRRRYGSARELREDIERYLDSRPLVARGDGHLYRLGKWIRRHRAASVAIVTSALLVTSLLGFGLVAIGQAKVLEAERNRAQAEARKAAEVVDFLSEMFASADPQNHQGAELTARALLALGKARIDGLEAPEVRLELLRILVRAYSNLGDYAEAADLGKRRVDGARRTGDPTILGNALVELADAERLAGRVEVAAQLLAEAEPLFQDANPGGLAFFYDALGDVERDRGHWPEAAETFRRSRDLWIEADDPQSAVVSNRALGVMMQFLGKLDEAEDAQRWGLKVLEELGEPDPLETLSARQALAMVISAQGRHGEAEGLLRDAVEGLRSIYGGDHPNVAAVMTNLATVLANDGRGADAEGVLLAALDMRRRLFPEDHPDIANSFHNLGSAILATRPEEAESYLRRALELRRDLLGSDHVAVAITLGNLADSFWLQERLRESLPMRREALRILEAQLPPESPDLAYAKKALARTLERLESPEESRKPP